MKLTSSNIKKISYIFSKESFSFISGNGTLHFSAQALKIKKNPPRENFSRFKKQKRQKNFLCFLKRKLL